MGRQDRQADSAAKGSKGPNVRTGHGVARWARLISARRQCLGAAAANRGSDMSRLWHGCGGVGKCRGEIATGRAFPGGGRGPGRRVAGLVGWPGEAFGSWTPAFAGELLAFCLWTPQPRSCFPGARGEPRMRHIAVCLMLIAAPVAAWSQASRETMTKTTTTLPPPPVAEQRPYSFERHGVTVQDPYHWLKDQSLPDRRRRGRALLPARRERLFRGGDGAAPAADRDPVPGDARPDPGGRQLGPGPGRRLALLVGVPARRPISHLVPPPRRRRRAAAGLRRAGRGPGQAIFPARRDGGQPRRPLRRDPGRRRRLRALPAAHPRPYDRPRRRDRHRGRHRRAGLDRRQPRHRLHRGQRPVAQLPRPAAPDRPAADERQDALRGDREYRLHGRRRPNPGPPLDPDLDRREQLERGPASSPPTMSRRRRC